MSVSAAGTIILRSANFHIIAMILLSPFSHVAVTVDATILVTMSKHLVNSKGK